MENKQKDEEKCWLDLFIRAYPDFPKGKISQDESPDFIINRGKKRPIGIEITQLPFPMGYPSPDWRHHIIQGAKKIYRKKELLPVNALFHFNPTQSVSSLTIDHWIEEITEIINKISTRHIAKGRKTNKHIKKDLPVFLESIMLLPSNNSEIMVWNICEKAPSAESYIHRINQSLQAKEEKFHLYRKKWFHESWLIILSTSICKFSEIHGLSTAIVHATNPSIFDKTFLFNPFESQYISINDA